jgi:hypothetical protein
MIKADKSIIVLVTFFFILFYLPTYAQKDSLTNTDSLQAARRSERTAKKKARRQKFLATLPKNHNPKTATLLALIPGAGQIYNRRYWKLPIVYGGLGALGFLTVSNYIEYGCYRKAYLEAIDDDPATNYQCEKAVNATSTELKILRDDTQGNAETFLLFSILFYGLTIGDAFVDAHLMHFDIDDDLSLRIQPQLNYSFAHRQVVPSLGLTVQARAKEKTRFKVQF